MKDRSTTAEQTRSAAGLHAYFLLLDRGDSVSPPGSLPRPDRPPKAAPSLIVRIDFVRARLELSGQLDRHTVHVLHDAISTLLQTDTDRWIIHVAGLTGFDPTGLRTIGATYRRARPPPLPPPRPAAPRPPPPGGPPPPPPPPPGRPPPPPAGRAGPPPPPPPPPPPRSRTPPPPPTGSAPTPPDHPPFFSSIPRRPP